MFPSPKSFQILPATYSHNFRIFLKKNTKTIKMKASNKQTKQHQKETK